jgi:hypothetical protein
MWRQGRRERVEWSRAWNHGDHVPSGALAERTTGHRWTDSGPHQRRLANPGPTRDQQHRFASQARDQRERLGPPTEEQCFILGFVRS